MTPRLASHLSQLRYRCHALWPSKRAIETASVPMRVSVLQSSCGLREERIILSCIHQQTTRLRTTTFICLPSR